MELKKRIVAAVSFIAVLVCLHSLVTHSFSTFSKHITKVKKHAGLIHTVASTFPGECPRENINIAIVGCGSKLDEATVLTKTISVLSTCSKTIWLHTEAHNINKLQNRLNDWNYSESNTVINIREAKYPSDVQRNEWKAIFKPCATLRVFLPNLLPQISKLIYLDADMVFLAAVEDLFSFFDQFNEQQTMALAENDADVVHGWYNKRVKRMGNKHPFFGTKGINTGVMLMRMDKLRKKQFTTQLMHHYQTYKKNISLGDQDLINIYLHGNAHEAYLLDCSWNYRKDFCEFDATCASARADGVKVVHGSRGDFASNRQPSIKLIHSAFTRVFAAAPKRRDRKQIIQEVLQIVDSKNALNAHSPCERDRLKYDLYQKPLRKALSRL